MSTVSACYYPPEANPGHLDRLVLFDDPADVAAGTWTEVHEQVQQILAALDETVRLRVPDVRVDTARTRGRKFYLFTYRTFSRSDDPHIDPVVVGLTFVREDHGEEPRAIIDADISGEATGDRIAAITRRTVPMVGTELFRVARESAAELSQYVPRIAEALLDPSRKT